MPSFVAGLNLHLQKDWLMLLFQLKTKSNMEIWESEASEFQYQVGEWIRKENKEDGKREEGEHGEREGEEKGGEEAGKKESEGERQTRK